MSSLFRLGQLLRGQIGIYTITKKLQETVWLATYEALEVKNDALLLTLIFSKQNPKQSNGDRQECPSLSSRE